MPKSSRLALPAHQLSWTLFGPYVGLVRELRALPRLILQPISMQPFRSPDFLTKNTKVLEKIGLGKILEVAMLAQSGGRI